MKKNKNQIIVVENKKPKNPSTQPLKTGPNIFIGTLNVFLQPARRRWKRHYGFGNKKWGLHLIADSIIFTAILVLIFTNIFLILTNRNLSQELNTPNYLNPTGVINAKLDLKISSLAINISPEQKTDYTINYENFNSFTLNNAEIIIYINNPLVEEQKLVFNQNNNNSLKTIAKNGKGQINFQLENKNVNNVILAGSKNPIAITSAIITFETGQKNTTKGFSFSNQLIQKISTPLTIKAFARYFTDEGEPVGFGAIPPKVGQKTRYWIIFKIEKFFNNINDLKLTAKLANNVSWTDKTSTTVGPTVKYDKTNQQITWQIEELNVPSLPISDIMSAIELEILPDQNQIGQIANLIENIEITGRDSFTDRIISQKLTNITTNLIGSDKTEISGGIVQ